jgi:hypothetical protein
MPPPPPPAWSTRKAVTPLYQFPIFPWPPITFLPPPPPPPRDKTWPIPLCSQVTRPPSISALPPPPWQKNWCCQSDTIATVKNLKQFLWGPISSVHQGAGHYLSPEVDGGGGGGGEEKIYFWMRKQKPPLFYGYFNIFYPPFLDVVVVVFMNTEGPLVPFPISYYPC